MIDAEKATYPIAMMCSLLRVSRSTFYAWRDRAESATPARRRDLAALVPRVFDDSRQTYGCRRVTAALNREGNGCSVGLVADLMRELGWMRATTGVQTHHRAGRAPRGHPGPDRARLHRTKPGARLVGDITYLRTDQGWLYLATVIDLATRMVVGWQMLTTCAPAWSSTH